MASLEPEVSINVQCSVCLDLCSDPKQLSCEHALCTKCYSDSLEHVECSSQSTADSITCPKCQNKADDRADDVLDHDSHDPLKSRNDDVRNSQQLCEICDTNSQALHFCCECDKNMCNTCLDNHNEWMPHLKHRVVRVEDIREGRVVLEKKVLSQEHKSDEQGHVCRPTHVCITCKKFTCSRCATLYHEKEGHTVQDAEDYNASVKTEIDYLLARWKMKDATINDHMICIATQKDRVSDHFERKESEIDKSYQKSIKKISEILNEMKAELHTKLEAQRVHLCENLDEMKDADERLISSIESASVLAGNSLKAVLDGDIVVIRDSLSDELKNLLDRDDPEKKLATDVADRAEQLIFTPNIQGDQLNIGEVKFMKCELECDVELSKKGRMNSMAATPDGRMAVGYSNGGIDIFSADGQLQQTVLKDVEIGDMELLSDGRYAVINGSGGIIVHTWGYEKLDIESLTNESRRLTVDSNDLIYVSNRKAKKIQVFSPAGGKAIREIKCDGYQPEQITSYNDSLVITYSNTMRIIDKEGNVKHEVKKSGIYPYAALTQSNSILISWVNVNDWLVSIDEYTNELKYIQTLISDHKIEKTERHWYYIQEFQSGEIAFCTPDRLYIFKLIITPVHG